MGRVYLGDRRI